MSNILQASNDLLGPPDECGFAQPRGYSSQAKEGLVSLLGGGRTPATSGRQLAGLGVALHSPFDRGAERLPRLWLSAKRTSFGLRVTPPLRRSQQLTGVPRKPSRRTCRPSRTAIQMFYEGKPAWKREILKKEKTAAM